MASSFLSAALAALVLLVGVLGLPATHADPGSTDDDHLSGDQLLSSSKDSITAQISSRMIQGSYHQMGYGGHGGHGLDLYSALALFSFAIFLGFLLYNYIRTQQSASVTGRIIGPDVGLPGPSGTRLAANVLSSLELWQDARFTMPNNPSSTDARFTMPNNPSSTDVQKLVTRRWLKKTPSN